jgi:uncharacterized membrane protein YphA (DoxX/SURF4 family)
MERQMERQLARRVEAKDEKSQEIAQKPITGPTDPFLRTVQGVVAWGELIGGITLVLGLLTRLSALCLMATQFGAIFSTTVHYGFSSGRRLGYEYNVALIIMCLAVILLGGGAIAVDRYFRRKPAALAPKPGEPVTV